MTIARTLVLMWAHGAAPSFRPSRERSRGRATRGSVYVEFLLVFIPLFLLCLGIVQLAFIYTAKLVVQHAATRAVRAAVVILDDDPAYYDGEERNRVVVGGSAPSGSPMEAFLEGIGQLNVVSGELGGARLRDIRVAASATLLAVAPGDVRASGDESIAGAIARGGDRVQTGAGGYLEAAVAVTFPDGPRGGGSRSTFQPDALVTVRVTYAFHCQVPMASRLMCRSAAGLGLTAAEAAQIDTSVLGLLEGRYLLLRAEGTLPNQSAGYSYDGEGS